MNAYHRVYTQHLPLAFFVTVGVVAGAAYGYSWPAPGSYIAGALLVGLGAVWSDGMGRDRGRWLAELVGAPATVAIAVTLFRDEPALSLLTLALMQYLPPLLLRFPPWRLQFRRWFVVGQEVVRWTTRIGLMIAGISGQYLATVAAVGTGVLVALFVIECALRLWEWREIGSWRHLRGLARSFLIYHMLPGRQRRMRAMYRQFVAPDALVFEVGAHLGNRIRALRALGARVVALEPQAAIVPFLNNWFGGDPQVTIIPAAAGATPGSMTLRNSPAHPTLATVSRRWMEQMQNESIFAGIAWDERYEVEVVTLDQLCVQYGEPAFIKVDVEGFEAEVLRGLSQPVAALSFEFLPAGIGHALECFDLLESPGRYEYNVSLVETMRFVFPDWVGAATARHYISGPGPMGRSGDVYARRRTAGMNKESEDAPNKQPPLPGL